MQIQWQSVQKVSNFLAVLDTILDHCNHWSLASFMCCIINSWNDSSKFHIVALRMAGNLFSFTRMYVAFSVFCHFALVLYKHVFLFLQIRQKLIVMISLSIHMMTSQDPISVQCVTNGLQGRTVWNVTNKYILQENCIHAVSVRNSIRLWSIWSYIWMFTAVNTSVVNVESVLAARET